VHIWFWGWLVAAVAMAAAGVAARDRAALPFAFGAGLAAALDASGLGPIVQWIAFVCASFIVFAVVNRRRHRPRHLRRGLGRHGVGPERES
jgi:membrane protein implicated in regulation of membrane protease activity